MNDIKATTATTDAGTGKSGLQDAAISTPLPIFHTELVALAMLARGSSDGSPLTAPMNWSGGDLFPTKLVVCSFYAPDQLVGPLQKTPWFPSNWSSSAPVALTDPLMIALPSSIWNQNGAPPNWNLSAAATPGASMAQDQVMASLGIISNISQSTLLVQPHDIWTNPNATWACCKTWGRFSPSYPLGQ
ncbi:hypothetical protein M9H77_12790 [Catharanthus roseus]|uniref:Uncharacterized protein n=1 Tax=Catharanthus roseus TaxID=4058 RepID=A0ACC0BIF5_CATRO|nr:hypothetical protein M9H77_12790 [Catharanthus roseus]